MVSNIDKEIVNISEFKRFVMPALSKGNQRTIITAPRTNNKNIVINDFNTLSKELISIANNFPHRRCAVTYKINNESNLMIEVHPVTESA